MSCFRREPVFNAVCAVVTCADSCAAGPVDCGLCFPPFEMFPVRKDCASYYQGYGGCEFVV